MDDHENEPLFTFSWGPEQQQATIRHAAKLAVVGIASQLLFRPVLNDLAGRKVRRLPLFAATYALWHALIAAPGIKVAQYHEHQRMIAEQTGERTIFNDWFDRFVSEELDEEED